MKTSSATISPTEDVAHQPGDPHATALPWRIRRRSATVYRPCMTFEERINELEDTVIRISYVLELKTGAYSLDGNPAVRDEGQQIERWARAIQERRAGT